jgi:hypothetical protein
LLQPLAPAISSTYFTSTLQWRLKRPCTTPQQTGTGGTPTQQSGTRTIERSGPLSCHSKSSEPQILSLPFQWWAVPTLPAAMANRRSALVGTAHQHGRNLFPTVIGKMSSGAVAIPNSINYICSIPNLAWPMKLQETGQKRVIAPPFFLDNGPELYNKRNNSIEAPSPPVIGYSCSAPALLQH